jgi:hypothetical protein
VSKVAHINAPVSALATSPDGVVAMGPDGMWDNRSGAWSIVRKPWANSISDVAIAPDGSVWIATGHGVFHYADGDIAKHLFDELVFGDVASVALDPGDKLWTGGFGGLASFDGYDRVNAQDHTSRLPSMQIQTLAFAPDGTLWTGSRQGCARWTGERWSVRHSRRWLLSDDVRDIAFDRGGTAWIATSKGVSAIKRRSMTLAQKADELMTKVVARHIRPPGIVEKCRLTTPGDLTTWEPADDDNDGQYTSKYLAMQSLRYAVTKDEEAAKRAREAFEAVDYLNTVTPMDGFVARTVIPVSWQEMADRNRYYTPETIADERVSNPRWKNAEPRWRKSDDGKWMWKGDTSSDEVVGHMFGMYYFHELVANADEKDRAKHHMVSMVDYIIDCGYVYRDIDGRHSKWGVWAPEKLNDDPDWRSEGPLNRVEMLAFLAFAHHLTGDAKYIEHYRRLADEHGYEDWVAKPKPTAPSERTHIDSFLLALIYPWLMECEFDAKTRTKYVEGHEYWYDIIKNDNNPFFEYAYAIHGTRPIDAQGCADFLRDAPLDLVEWTVDNSQRGDIDLIHEPERWPYQTTPLPPPSERGVMRWDKNPFDAVRGKNGGAESSGVYWLLPYWMGRYYGHIGAPE